MNLSAVDTLHRRNIAQQQQFLPRKQFGVVTILENTVVFEFLFVYSN